MRPALSFVNLRGISIYEQLRLEELMLRCSTRNFAIINSHIPTPSIVVGFSGL